MSDFFDERDNQDPAAREEALFARVPALLEKVKAQAPGWADYLKDVDPSKITDRASLASVPVLRKAHLQACQKAKPPFGGFVMGEPSDWSRVFMSPGPIWEPQGLAADPWRGVRALHAAGFRKNDIVHNAFAYHMTPGGFILDESARALGCAVFPAGVGNTEAQVEAMAMLQPAAYIGTPDYLKVILDKADEMGVKLESVTKAMVSGGALFPSLRDEYKARGVETYQCYATADLGIIAYESPSLEGMLVNEDLIVEIVRPGTDEPVADGEVGELVVTCFSDVYPLIRFGTGDLSAVLPGQSPCGRTAKRIKGWMGRADQRCKIKGMFVDPAQMNVLLKRFDSVDRLRLVVSRADEQDVMTLQVATSDQTEGFQKEMAEALKDVTKLKGVVNLVASGSLPNDGQVIVDERDYS
ncbi:MAG: phenylacetate--CoA ligase family protein [Cohaesibacter sp.]|jgi:phenylacetate-CoA ligase|nr:phenylacetate--CoA ligase family protein [Cohaesibacter sp.]